MLLKPQSLQNHPEDWLNIHDRDFPGCPMVKILPSKAGGVSLIPGQGAKIPPASQPKDQNINSSSNIVTNSLKTLKMVHIKKKKKK